MEVKELITALKNRDEDVWQKYIHKKENAMQHMISTTIGLYGEEELKSAGMELDDCRQEMLLAMTTAVSRYEYDEDLTDAANRKKFEAYVNIYLKNSLRRAIEERNGVSKCYAGLLLALKKRHVDLYESSMEDICCALCCTAQGRGYKDLPALVERLRVYFKKLEHVDIDDVTEGSYTEDFESRIIFEQAVKRLEKASEPDGFKWFMRHYMDGFPVTSIAREERRAHTTIRKGIDETMEKAKAIFTREYGRMEEFRLNVFSDAHQQLSLQEMIDAAFEE